MEKLAHIVVRTVFRILLPLSPRLAGRLGFRLFCSPIGRSSVPPAVESVMEEAEPLALSVVGQRVQGYRWAAPEGSPRVLLVHGWRSRGARLAVWVEPLVEAGFEVLAFDGPAHGRSEGSRTDPLEFASLIRDLAGRFGPLRGIVAHSFGVLASVLAVAGDPDAPLPVDGLVGLGGIESGVDALTMFREILDLPAGLDERMLEAAAERVGRPMESIDARRLLAASPLPILWFHDPDDGEAPVAGPRRVVDACPESVELVETVGLGHHRIAREPRVMRRAIGFLASLGESARVDPERPIEAAERRDRQVGPLAG